MNKEQKNLLLTILILYILTVIFFVLHIQVRNDKIEKQEIEIVDLKEQIHIRDLKERK